MKKSKLILLEVITAISLICTSAYAAVSATIGITPNSKSVERGEKFIVSLNLEDIDSGKKVESVEGYINYNTEILKDITVNSIQKDADGTVTIGTEKLKVEDLTNKGTSEIPSTNAYVAFNGNPASNNQSKIVIDFEDGMTSDVKLLDIEFEVKSDANVGTTDDAITYSMFVVTENSETSEKITKTVDLIVKAPEDNPAGGNNNPQNDPTNNNTNTNTNNNTINNTNTNTNNNTVNNTNTNKNTNNTVNNTNNTVNNTNKNTNNTLNKVNNANTNDNTSSSKKLPSTGAKMVILPLLAVIILAYISYNRYIKYRGI